MKKGKKIAKLAKRYGYLPIYWVMVADRLFKPTPIYVTDYDWEFTE